ncbi:MAG TPA: vitamin K epoxide reductase family protein [Candidatus Microsaccharimonas sp.]|jgi:uncharacterized membrane protein
MFNKLFKKTPVGKRYRYVTFGFMLLGGIAALIAAFVLTLDKFKVLEDPNAVLSCSINIVLNCSKVMETWQSHVFGFPNMLIGLMAFPVLITIAVLGLSGTKFPRWFLISSNIALLLGFLFSYWLFFESVYVIQVLCPWCLVVTTSMTIMLSSYLHFNLKENTFKLKDTLNTKVQYFLKSGFHQMIVLSWIALMVVLVFLKFGQALFA